MKRQASKRKPRLEKVTALFLLALIAFGLNFHLFFLQLYGWSGMLIDFRGSSDSWTAAAQKTISGDAPCDVCRHVEMAMLAGDEAPAAAAAKTEIAFHPWLFLILPGGKSIVSHPPFRSETFELAMLIPTPTASPPTAPPPRPTVS